MGETMRRKFKRLPLPELAIGSTEFRLVGEVGADPERLERERIQRDQDKRSGQEFDRKHQTEIPL